MVLTCKQDLINAGVLDVDINNMKVLVQNSFTYNEPRWISAYWDKTYNVYRINLAMTRERHMPTAVYARLVYCWTHPDQYLGTDNFVLPITPLTGNREVDVINAVSLKITPKQKGKRNKERGKKYDS